MSVQEQIKSKLTAALGPSHLEVINESHGHRVPAGSETHFKVVVISASFRACSLVARHKMVYAALADELQAGVHALAITAHTPEEWALSPTSHDSPPCLGGEKRH